MKPTRRTLPALALLALALLPPACASAPTAGAPAPAGAATATGADPLAGATQAVLVLTADWDAVPGTMRRFERASTAAAWHPVGDEIPVVVGRGGLGWGIGLHGGPPAAEGPVKREGDGKAPAGVFALGPAFGYAPAAEVPWIRLPYVHSTDAWKCVDDPASVQYNRLLDQGTVRKDWKSQENMRLASDAYRLGAVVQHNWDGATRPGAGSCIFLHVWGGPGSSTVGCTAMASADIEALLRWLDPERRPALVQLPRAEYQRLHTPWRLP